MTSSVPYLLRAIHEWIMDNDCTPYLIIDANVAETQVPQAYVKDGQIVLNISPMAIRDLLIDDNFVVFSGRFGGVSHHISAPMQAVMGIVAKENGEGMWFPRDDVSPEPPPPPPERQKRPPALKVIK